MKTLKSVLFIAAILISGPAHAACWQWSRTAAANGTADPTINFAEGQSSSSVNDSARAMMARLAECRDDLSGVLQTTGGAVTYAVATNQGLNATPVDGQQLTIRLNVTNGSAPTMAADGGGGFPFQTSPAVAPSAGTMIAGTPYRVTFSVSASAWLLQDYYNAPLANGAVTYPKIQNVGALRLLGNPTGSPAQMSEISLGTGMAWSGTSITSTNPGLVPTIQFFTTGSGATYTTPAGVSWLEVIVQGGGSGGGGGNSTTLSTAGGTTSFGAFSAGGGQGSSYQVVGAGGAILAGGYLSKPGQPGSPGNGPGLNHNGQGGTGGSTDFAGGGVGPSGNAAGAVASGAGAGGGGGGNSNGSLDGAGGNGGSAGATVRAFINSPAATYTYTVGSGGAGAAGTNINSSAGGSGGLGGGGYILVIEHY